MHLVWSLPFKIFIQGPLHLGAQSPNHYCIIIAYTFRTPRLTRFLRYLWRELVQLLRQTGARANTDPVVWCWRCSQAVPTCWFDTSVLRKRRPGRLACRSPNDPRKLPLCVLKCGRIELRAGSWGPASWGVRFWFKHICLYLFIPKPQHTIGRGPREYMSLLILQPRIIAWSPELQWTSLRMHVVSWEPDVMMGICFRNRNCSRELKQVNSLFNGGSLIPAALKPRCSPTIPLLFEMTNGMLIPAMRPAAFCN